MTPDEILTHALQHANGKDPVDLALRMKDFLDGKLSTPIVFQLPAPDKTAAQDEPALEIEPEENHTIQPDTRKRKSPTYPKVRPPNHCRPWKDEELLQAADLVKDAKTRRDLENIAWKLGRTKKGFVDCLYKGLIPVDPATLHKTAFPMWDKVPYPKAPE